MLITGYPMSVGGVWLSSIPHFEVVKYKTIMLISLFTKSVFISFFAEHVVCMAPFLLKLWFCSVHGFLQTKCVTSIYVLGFNYYICTPSFLFWCMDSIPSNYSYNMYM